MNRIDRVSAILIQLQGKKVVKAQHIADRFNISLRTVYRDIKSLEEAGIPVAGEAGIGYSLMEGYRLPPVMFSREEAIAFLTAEKLVEKLTDQKNAANYKSAMYKIRAVLRGTEKDLLEQIDNQIEVLRINRGGGSTGNHTETILNAIGARRNIIIDYFSHHRQEMNKREVEPVGIFHLDHYWHLIGFCLMRQDYRDFRFDRISGLSVSGQLQQREHPPLKSYIESHFNQRTLYPVRISVTKECHSHLTDQKYYMGFIDEQEQGSNIEMSFLTASIDGFAKWFLMLADRATIIEPVELKNKTKTLAEKILSSF